MDGLASKQWLSAAIALTAALSFAAPQEVNAAPPVSDDFNWCALQLDRWTVVDPVGDCEIEIIGAGTGNAQLQFVLPAGSEHDGWIGSNHIARVVQNVDNADFTVEVKIDSPVTQVYQGAGIIVLEDDTRFIRCEWHRAPDGPKFFIASVLGASATVHHYANAPAGAPIWLRLARTGNNWTASYSTNGTTFSNIGSFSSTLAVSQLGPYALNAGTAPGNEPAFSALIDYFFNTASPIANEDQGSIGDPESTLTINVAGNGIVLNDPLGPDYACGETVTLTAVPGPGAGFAGWSGDLISLDNPALFTVTQDSVINATFVSDNTPPSITCPQDFIAEFGMVPAASFAGGIVNDDLDPAPQVTYTDALLPGNGCPEVHRIQRTWRAEDAAGNVSICVQTIFVHDTTSPAILNVPPDASAECGAVPAPPGNVVADDAADPAPQLQYVETIVDGDCPGRYTIERRWTATDACGNVRIETQNISVRDTTRPSIIVTPAVLTVPCESVPPPAVPIVSDNCDPAPFVSFNEVISSGSCATGYTITRTWSATDSCGNTRYASQVIHVVDTTAPLLTPPPDITIGCTDSTLPSSTGCATAIDSADPDPNITFSDTPILGGCPLSVSVSRTWTATDWAGNQSSAVQTITVADLAAPKISGIPEGELVVQCGNIPAPPKPIIIDNCDPSPFIQFTEERQPSNDNCATGFTILRTWTAVDDCGNTSVATQTLRLFDTKPPLLFVPPDVVVNCAPSRNTTGSAPSTDPASTGMATANDDCDAFGTVNITYSDLVSPGSIDAHIVATIKRTWKAMDGCGNFSTGTQTIRLVDHTAPVVLQSPPDVALGLAQLADPDNKRMLPLPDFRDQLVVLDMCSDEIIIKQKPAPGTLLGIGTRTVTFDVSDEFGNVAVNAARMIVKIVPSFNDRCPDDPDKLDPGFCGCGVPETDSDGDGVPDCVDGCPNDPAKIAPGACGCGNPDTDSDGDGTPDCIDECPDDPLKQYPGSCGCNALDTDSDGDGFADCVDACPNDPDKQEPGLCGCGTPDIDSDNDGTPDCLDACADDPEKTQPGACGCGVADDDLNRNEVADCLETCPASGDCFVAHETAGCAFPDCCATVCAVDPYCCTTAWDVVCVSQAITVCEAPQGNECDDPIVIADGSVQATLTDNSGTTGDDTTGPGCSGVVDTIDEWYSYTSQVNGTATATTCSVNTQFPTTLAVFTACGGPALVCNAIDGECDTGSTIEWEVEFGTTYLIRVSAVDDQVGGYELIIDSEAAAVDPAILAIDFWYGQNQHFGAIGQPQRQVNLLGNVHSIHGVQTLQYELNGAPPLPLSIGPDTRRLYHPGDFNVELFYAELPEGPNQCLVRAIDNQGNVVTRTLNFLVSHAPVWPLPYAIDWSTAADIQSVAQVVDGYWEIVPGGVRIMQQGYDRLVALGDITWTNYEITCPITIHAVDPNGYLPPSFTPGIGLILRWEGHTDFLEPGSQPMTGYWPLGCAAEFVYHVDQCGARLQLYGNPFVLQDQDPTCSPVPFDETFMWKVRVETLGNGTHFYQFKVWPQGDPEPPGWTLDMIEPANHPTRGCLMLFSHHVDATFGNVQVVPVP